MKHAFIQHNGEKRLIVIFAGWGMDQRPFLGLERPGYDIMAVWDYRTLDFDPSWTEGYEEVCVLAWSMGVQAAQLCHNAIAGKVTARIAVGGTQRPVDDECGIPHEIFSRTLDGLDERSLDRFMRRMCGGAKAYAGFEARRPERDIDGLRHELRAIGERCADDTCAPRFDHYLLTARDAIFPPENQRRAFCGTDIVECDSPHLPDFQHILDNYFIDKSLVSERFGRASESYDANAEAQALIADYMANLLRDTDSRAILSRKDADVLEVGCGTGLLSRRIAAMKPSARLTYHDISPVAPQGIDARTYKCCDAETSMLTQPAKSLDMIISASTMQWFNSPERFVERSIKALRPGGILAVSTFGRGNMPETAEASGVGLHLCGADIWREAVAAMPDAEIMQISTLSMQCRFDTAIDALRHISLTGVNAISRSGGNARSIAGRMLPDENGQYTITYEPLFILLRKKP